LWPSFALGALRPDGPNSEVVFIVLALTDPIADREEVVARYYCVRQLSDDLCGRGIEYDQRINVLAEFYHGTTRTEVKFRTYYRYRFRVVRIINHYLINVQLITWRSRNRSADRQHQKQQR
jgi:hypothetical protein